MRAPDFWSREGGMLPLLLSPIAAVYAGTTARRMARGGWRAPVPVLCCGGATAGGAGKTTLALDLGRRLQARGLAPHFLLRGYGGSAKGPLRVIPERHGSETVGDEALLLAAQAPTWVSADRAAGARLAVAEGAGAIVMDDGLQNPTLEKSVSLLTIDGNYGFGNRRVIPAGPLRESVAAAAARCAAAVLIGPDETGALAALPEGLPVLRCDLVPGPEMAELAGQNVFAFCGIANPRKFFNTLRLGGAVLAGTESFADHYPFDEGDLREMLARAEALGAVPVTTRKDWVRIPQAFRERVRVVTVALAWEDEGAVGELVERLMVPSAQE
ncbi:MAG: tetraacyldisaccharide 4'-kinase [Rubritepida sp.]|jgi:tetraacyldisaccharide 4'-kinase|nr:tetraacyldisaccharide 4'-kinase [Rubritepida sp.]